MRVLVCDDDATLREFLGSLFEAEHWSVDCVASGEECLEAVSSGGVAPDVIVLDQVMDGLQGTQVAHRLRADGYDRPIILCSAHLGPKQKSVLKRLDLLGMNKIDARAVVRVAAEAVREQQLARRPVTRQVWPD